MTLRQSRIRALTAGGTGNGPSQNPYSFKSGTQDRATGLVKFGLRWYDATAGMWTQQDTLDAPLSPSNANRYAFAALDPINNYDPTGASCLSSSLQFAGATAVTLGTIAGGIISAPPTGGVGAIVFGTVLVGELAAYAGSAAQVVEDC